jgi:hypothetical protein
MIKLKKKNSITKKKYHSKEWGLNLKKIKNKWEDG